MTEHDIRRSLFETVFLIEGEMRARELWDEENIPDEDAFESSQPFYHDTMSFCQWLQWIFVPKMTDILESHYALPQKSDIVPIAVHRFKHIKAPTDELLNLIRRFDNLIALSEA